MAENHPSFDAFGDNGNQAFGPPDPSHASPNASFKPQNESANQTGKWFESMRPLVRYVDQDKAIVETKFRTRRPVVHDGRVDVSVDAVLHLTDAKGFEDEIKTRLVTVNGLATARFEMVCPQRWWPACMGEQSLYTLTVRLEVEGVALETHHALVGLTSVRIHGSSNDGLWVNAQPCPLKQIVHVDHIDQAGLLPAGADALLVVRDHYAPETFFDATDRAGILALQCVPVAADGQPDANLAGQVERLSAHPSLMGYYVGHLGPLAESLAQTIRHIDPTRAVYRAMPVAG